MDFSHNDVVAFAKSYGLFYLIALSIIALLYAYWPSNKERFDHAAKAILDDADENGDKPCP